MTERPGERPAAGTDQGPGTADDTSATGATGTERGEHVGRIQGADPGYVGETGAERRAAAGTGGGDGDGSRQE